MLRGNRLLSLDRISNSVYHGPMPWTGDAIDALRGLKRVSLAHLPTPTEPLDRLSTLLGGPRVWVKRDDCTGLATGGNKTRKVEFLMADALAKGADTVVTVGAIQSNHARQVAAASVRLGFRCVLALLDAVPNRLPVYRKLGNTGGSVALHAYPEIAGYFENATSRS